MSVAEVLSGARRWHVDCADCLAWLAALPDDAVDLVFGSPPYELARIYLENGEDMGIARDTEQWVAWMVEVYRACLRVCRGLVAFVVEGQTRGYRYSCGPALLMADLHRAGVRLRKPPLYVRDGIPGSGGPDWLKNRYEFIVCATRGGRLPWADPTAHGHTPKCPPGGAMSNRRRDGSRVNGTPRKPDGSRKTQGYKPPALANPGNLIDCGPAGGGRIGNVLAHENEAPFPEQLAAFFVQSFCPPGGVVLDCFAGSGTTAAVAVRHGRRFVGCDLRASQAALARRRVEGETPTMFTGEGDA